MAVKKHKLVAENHKHLDLIALAKYFQLLNEQPNYLPQSQELVKHCQDILKCLSRTVGTEEQLWQLLQPVEEFLLRIVTSVHCNIRHQILIAILDKFYTYISDPQLEVYPTTAAVLVVIESSDEETILSAARWIVNQRKDEPNGTGHAMALSRLYYWLYEWHGTPALGNWLLAYIKALEEHERFDILIESSLEHIENLFLAMGNQVLLRRSYADVVFHVLSSLRESTEAFDRISSHIDSVLVNLASESSQWSRQLLQTLVDILTAMVDQIIVHSTIEEQEEFREKYSDVILCLERHISSRTSSFLPAWRSDNISTMSLQLDNTVAPTKIKVGLVNLGNTCYMNSVLQALFAARKFSIHVMMNLDGGTYWSHIGELFAKMLYSMSPTVAPIEVYKAFKPPFFNTNHQHDSSEFLGYLFHLLRSCDHNASDTEKHNFNYTPAPTRNSGHNPNCMCVLYYDPSDKMSQAGSSDGGAHSLRGVLVMTNSLGGKEVHHAVQEVAIVVYPGTNMVAPECRVHSPGRWVQQATAGGPGVCYASGSSKRSAPELESCPLKKRLRSSTHNTRRNTFVEDMFGGSLLTRVECRQCHSYSISRDVFCELQLSFPEKLMDKTHSIQSLLEYYCSVERLSGENRYQCRDCCGLRDADRSVRIDKSPVHLVLVLKNFEFDVKNKVNAKLMHNVSCNRNIVLPTVRSQKKGSYNLFAAVIHSGIYIDSGHYYTVAKDEDGWYRYDDSAVTIFDEKLLNNLGHACTPYILFYKRSDVEDVRLPAFHELPQQLQDSVFTHNKLYKNQR